jgi:UDP-N-acetylmuramate--alanine ligase
MITFSPSTCGTLHFIGIGGIGMSGIAEVLATLGYRVQGSDSAANYNTKRLEENGVHVFMGHDAAHIAATPDQDITAVIISSAIKSDNPELLAARAAHIPVVRRADMLAEIMRHKKCVAVAGTHGKTTTTSMIDAVLNAGGFDPTIVNGGIVQAHGTNARLGAGEWMVVESDESDGSFTRLPATVAVVTNIDPEHLDHYGSFDGVRRAYKNFIENIPFYGFAVLCADHPEVTKIVPCITDRRVYTYGIYSTNADIFGTNIRTGPDGAVFDVTFGPHITGGAPETIMDLHLPMMGIHNVQNILAALTIARAFEISKETMRSALENFAGVKRRFTKTGIAGGITVIDDYAHHPVEIQATLRAARQAVSNTGGHVIAVMQPHRFTRLSDLMTEFAGAFADADRVIVTDVYTAGEAPIDGVTSDVLAEMMRATIKPSADNNDLPVGRLKDVATCTRLNDPTAMPQVLAEKILETAAPGDLVLCLGAGSITQWAYALPDALAEQLEQSQKQKQA